MGRPPVYAQTPETYDALETDFLKQVDKHCNETGRRYLHATEYFSIARRVLDTGAPDREVDWQVAERKYGLTRRQLHTLRFWLGAMSYKAIAEIAGINEKTVEYHIGKVLQKMGIYAPRRDKRITVYRKLVRECYR